jgi:hypothetical protein
MPAMMSVPPALLPASDEARRVRRLRMPDRPLVQELYERHVRERGHFALARRPEWWERRLWGYEGEWVVYERRRGQIEGYLHVQIDAGDGPWKLVLTVNEFVAHTPDAHRGLTGYLHGLRDQAVEVIFSTPADAPWAAQLGDAANLRGDLKLSVVRTTGHLGYGAMLRLLDVKGALEALPVSPSGPRASWCWTCATRCCRRTSARGACMRAMGGSACAPRPRAEPRTATSGRGSGPPPRRSRSSPPAR